MAGGGIDAGEFPEAAVAREVREETGLRLSPSHLGPVVATRVARFDFEGRRFRQTVSFFAVAVAPFAPATLGWDDVERRSLSGNRWWPLEELRPTDEVVYPAELAEVVDAVLDGGIVEAIDLSNI